MPFFEWKKFNLFKSTQMVVKTAVIVKHPELEK